LDVTVQVSARLLAVVTALPEGFAIFELREPFPNAQILKLREKPLSRNEPVRGIAYLDRIRFAKGRFAEIAGSSDIPGDHPFAKVRRGSGLFEMWDIEERNNDRSVLDHGASGAPIVDCEVIRVVSAMSAVSLLYPQEPTSSVRRARSEKCHERSLPHRLFDHLVGQRDELVRNINAKHLRGLETSRTSCCRAIRPPERPSGSTSTAMTSATFFPARERTSAASSSTGPTTAT
jgi:hypothetical protein